MSEELVYRMRTCAAALLGNNPLIAASAVIDAADLLVEASNVIDVREEVGEPMAVLEAVAAPTPSGPIWTSSGDSLPAVTPKPCPSCGNIAARKVRIAHRHLYLTCPMCDHEWEYKP